MGTSQPLDIFRDPNELDISEFDDVWNRATALDDGTRVPDVIDLLVTKQATGRDKDMQDIAFLEAKAEREKSLVPTDSAVRVTDHGIANRFAEPSSQHHPVPVMKPVPHPFASEVGSLTLAELHNLGDEAVRELLAGFVPLTHASEIAIWAKDPAADQLVGLLETAGPAGEFEMKVTQPLAEGIVSQVYRDQTDHLDQGLWRDKAHSLLVDDQLQQLTVHEMCVPFHLAGHPLGVMSAVQINDPKHTPPSRWGFDDEDLKTLKLAALALGQAMERALLAKQLGR